MKVRLELDIPASEASQVATLVTAFNNLVLSLNSYNFTAVEPQALQKATHAHLDQHDFPSLSASSETKSAAATSSCSGVPDVSRTPPTTTPTRAGAASDTPPPSARTRSRRGRARRGRAAAAVERANSPGRIFESVALGNMAVSDAINRLCLQLQSGTTATTMVDACATELADATRVMGHPTRGVHLVSVMKGLGEECMRLFKQQFVGMAVKEFIKAREISCDRTLFLGYSDGLAALVKEECISMEAGLKTAARLLGSEECWTAGITTLCKLAEVGGKSFDTSVALVKEVQWKLGVLAKQDEFVYDIKYLNSVTGWDIAVAR